MPGHGENAFGYMSGTSMAVPHVTASVGVVKSNFPELTGAEISVILRETARDLGAPGVDEIYGHGLLDLANAVAPQGRISVMTGSSIADGSKPLEKSWISGDSSMASALSRSLWDWMMVADRYMRGFRTDLGQMVARPEHDGDLLQAELAAFIGQRPKPVPFGVSTSRSGIHMDNAREWAQPNAMKSAYTALADGQHLNSQVRQRSAYSDQERLWQAGCELCRRGT